MAEPAFAPRVPDKQHLLDLTRPPPPNRAVDSEGYEEWDDEEEADEYDTEDEEEEEEEEDEEEIGEEQEEEEREEMEQGNQEVKKEKDHDQRKEEEKLATEQLTEEKKELQGGNEKNEDEKESVDDVETISKTDDGTSSKNSCDDARFSKNERNVNEGSKHTRDTEKINTIFNKPSESLGQQNLFAHEHYKYQEQLKKISTNRDRQSLKIKERINRHLRPSIEEDADRVEEFHLKPGIPFRTRVEEQVDIAAPKRKPRRKTQQAAKPVIDEDDLLSELELEDHDAIGDPWPEELVPVPEIGSEKWKALMEQIMYKNPYEGYVPEETKEPMEAYWDRIDLLDYQEGRWVDEEEFEKSSDLEPVTMQDFHDLVAKMKREFDQIDRGCENG